MSLTPIARDGSALGEAALAAAVATIRNHQETARTEKALADAESEARQAKLTAAQHELERAAAKAVAGAAVTAALKVGAAVCEIGVLKAPTDLVDRFKVAGTICGALASSGEVISASAGFNQATKARLDREAEVLQQRAQNAEKSHTAADEAIKRELAAMKELITRMHETARSATRI